MVNQTRDPNISQRELLTRLNKDPNIEITCSQIEILYGLNLKGI